MAEGNAASRTRHEARERIRLITEELARRSRTEHLKAEAGALRDRLTAKAKAKAHEKADDLKARAKGAALDKGQQLKEQMMAKPVALGILGGVAGAVVGAILGRRAEDSQHYVRAGTIETTGVESARFERRGYDIEEGAAPYYGEREATSFDESPGIKEKAKEKVQGAMGQAREKAGDLKERARDMKDRAMEAVSDAREKLSDKAPSVGGMKSRADGIVREDPMMLAFGAIAFGAFLGLVMPLTDTERRTLRSAHLKAKEGLHSGVERAQEMISDRAGDVVPALLGVKKKHERREASADTGRIDTDQLDLNEEREIGSDVGVSANPDALEPPAIH